MTDEDDLGPGCLSCAAFVCMLVAVPAIIVAEAVADAVNFIFSKTKKKERTR